MLDDKDKHQDRTHGDAPPAGHTGRPRRKESDGETAELSCAAFGYLRGIRERAEALELRFQNGNSMWFPYTWLGNWQYNPSDGLLIKFSGDLIYLILVRGSNLDRPLSDTTTNLTSSGLQRHRIVWMREMSKEEARQVGETAPTIDSIEVVEFESNDDLKEWLAKTAPAFLH
jgi:hypothetical protein